MTWVCWGLESTGLHKFTLNKEEILRVMNDTGSDIAGLGDQSQAEVRWRAFFDGIDENYLEPQARLAFGRLLGSFAANRAALFEYVRKHREVQNIELKPQIFIVGLPRTGSTMLQLLLAGDRNARSLRLWEVGMGCISMPPARSYEESLTDPRAQQCQKVMDGFGMFYKDLWANISASHHMTPLGHEEELMTLYHTGAFMTHSLVCTLNDDFADLLYSSDCSDSYRYLRLFYQAVQSGYAPKSHWVCKTPIHTLYLPALKTVFPESHVVFTARDPCVTVASYAILTEALMGPYFPEGDLDRRKIGQASLRLVSEMCKRIIEFQKNADPKEYINIDYRETTSDPVGTVKKIYSHFGIPFTAETEQDVLTVHSVNPQGKHGRNKYTLEMFGLTKGQVREATREYCEKFVTESCE